MTKTDDSARLVWVEAALATAAYGGFDEAAEVLGVSRSTVKRRVDKLETWLRRLIFNDEPFELFPFGEDFMVKALRIFDLTRSGGLNREESLTRIMPDGAVVIEGRELKTTQAKEIGALLIGSRAPYVENANPPTRASPWDIVVP